MTPRVEDTLEAVCKYRVPRKSSRAELEKSVLRVAPEHKSYDANRRKFLNYYDLDIVYMSSIYLLQVLDTGKGWVYSASFPNGKIIRAKRIKETAVTAACEKFKRTSLGTGVTCFCKRVNKLHAISHNYMRFGFSDKAMKAMDRLSLVAFTSNYKTFKRLTNSILQNMDFRFREVKLAINPPHPRGFAGRIPVRTGETKPVFIDSDYTLDVPVWRNRLRSREIPHYEDFW